VTVAETVRTFEIGGDAVFDDGGERISQNLSAGMDQGTCWGTECNRPGGKDLGVGQGEVTAFGTSGQDNFAAQCFEVGLDTGDNAADAAWSEACADVDQMCPRSSLTA
jgi:hypothetical protein